jgi:hypothetical protein
VGTPQKGVQIIKKRLGAVGWNNQLLPRHLVTVQRNKEGFDATKSSSAEVISVMEVYPLQL